MENNYEEYITFQITASDGREVELAVVDEFDFEDKHYVVGALVKDDMIDESSSFIYESVMTGDDFEVKRIERAFDYNRIAKAYLEMEE